MKIGFCGAQGTGKTSVAQEIGKLEDWFFVPSAVSDVAKAGFYINQEAGPLDQLVVTTARIAQEFLYDQREYPNIVLDRTVLDSLAYTGYQLEKHWKFMSPTQVELYWKTSFHLVRKQMQEYDKIFYFPIYWAPEPREDGLRVVSEKYQKDVDTYIAYLLDAMSVPHYTMLGGTVEDRANFVMDMLS